MINITTKEISNLVSVENRSVKQLVKNYLPILKEIGEVKTVEIGTGLKGGRPATEYALTTKKQLAFISSRMNRKADVSKLNSIIGETAYVFKRKEYSFYETIRAIVEGFQNDLIIKCDYSILNHRVDIAVFHRQESLKCLVMIIEYDEDNHKFHTEEDIKREKDILKAIYEADSEYDEGSLFPFMRVKEDEELAGIRDVVEYLNSLLIICNSSTITNGQKYLKPLLDLEKKYPEIKETLKPLFEIKKLEEKV